jgi:hypothetical protein
MVRGAHMIATFRVFGLIMAGSIICLATEDSQSTAGESLEARRQHHEETVLGYLRDVAWSSRKAIRLYYQADCQPMKTSVVDYSVPFPLFPLQPPSADNSGVAAVREIFKNAEDVRIAEEPLGIIRIWVGKVPTEILRTRISLLTLDRQAQYDPSSAIGAIESTKEVEAAKNSLGLSDAPVCGGLVALAENGLPCLPASIKNITVDQALDMIAKTWGGPIVFGVCSSPTDTEGKKLFLLGNGAAVLGQPF